MDRLIDAMDVRMSAFALLNISAGYRLFFNGSASPTVHFVLSGDGIFQFPDDTVLAVKTGDVVLLPPSCRKTIRTGNEPYIDVRTIDQCRAGLTGLLRVDAGPEPANLTILCGLIGLGVFGSYGLFAALRRPLCSGLHAIPVAQAAFALLRHEIAVPAIATQALAGSLMKACLILTVRQHLDELLAPYGILIEPSQERLRCTLVRVLECPGDPHSVVSLARDVGMSRTSFARVFKATFKMSPMAFVMKVRLHNAAKLLTTTDLPVKMVAASAGLTRSHFSRAFRAAYGQDPVTFRNAALQILSHRSVDGGQPMPNGDP